MDAQGRPITVPDRATVDRQLQTVRPECDLPEGPDDSVEVRIGRGLKYPKDNGYATFLSELGWDPNWAGMLAAMIVHEGRVRAATAKRSTEFRKALKRLANPRLEPMVFLAEAKVALEVMDQSTVTRGLFGGLPITHGFVFIGGLRQCVAGDLSLRSEVIGIAAVVWPRVKTAPGRKLTAASAAHEYFLESQSIFKPAAFTWSPVAEDFIDRLTQATREEFGDPNFNPSPARRRLRAKQG